MSRSGPTGQLGMKPQPRRSAADELFRSSQPTTQPGPHWPPQPAEQGQRSQQQGYGQAQGFNFPQPAEAEAAHAFAQHAPAQPAPFPSQGSGQQPPFNRYPQPGSEQEPSYGYAQGQHGAAPLPWGQQGDPRGYDLG